MTLVLDAGALMAVDSSDRRIVALVKTQMLAGRPPRSHGGVVGQVWRGGVGRQALLRRLLAGMEVVPLDDRLAMRAGALLAQTGMSDVVDAAIVLLAGDGDEILTSDPHDLHALAAAAGSHIEIVPV